MTAFRRARTETSDHNISELLTKRADLIHEAERNHPDVFGCRG